MVVALAVLAGCGDSAPPPDTGETAEGRTRAPAAQEPRLRPARCPSGAANCAAAVGRVLFIESVDPDGDGDLHVVATAVSGDAVTGPGLVVFDVGKDLRPRRDPRAGDLVTGAGPVYTGSFGQRQIEVDEFRVARR